MHSGFFGEILSTLKVKSLSRVRLFATPWTVAYQESMSQKLSFLIGKMGIMLSSAFIYIYTHNTFSLVPGTYFYSR